MAAIRATVTALDLAFSLRGVPFLGTAAIALGKIAQDCEDIQVHKSKAKHLANRCTQFLSILDKQGSALAGTDFLIRVVDVLPLHEKIEKRIRRWSRYNAVTAFVKKDDIQQGIELWETELNLAARKFEINATILMDNHIEAQEIQERDAAQIRDLLYQILANQGGELQQVKKMQDTGEHVAETIMLEGQRELRTLHENGLEGDEFIIANARSTSPPLPNDGQRYFQHQRRLIQRGLIELHHLTGIPPSMKLLNGEIVKVDAIAVAGGTYSDIWEGIWMGEKKVALKALRNIKAADQKARKRFEHEIAVWADLFDDHILRFYGIVTNQGQHIHMVSPWQENGNVLDYVKSTPDANKIHLLSGAAKGLEYLHSRHITHGNVKCANILVSSTGEACICDFGMSKVIDEIVEKSASVTLTAAGSARWLAPELIEGAVTSPTTETDTYSYAMVILELLTGKHPFSNRRRDASVIHDVVVLKKIPIRPTDPEVLPWLTDDLWTVMTECWKWPSSRPPMAQVSGRIREIDEYLASNKTELFSTQDVRYVPSLQRSPELSKPLSPSTETTYDDTTVEPRVSPPKDLISPEIVAYGHELEALVARLETLFADRGQYKQLLACRNLSAQGLLDMFQKLLDVLELSPTTFRRDLIVATQRLAGASGLYPACYELKSVMRIGDDSESSGGFADVYKGNFQGRLVCLKEIRFNGKTEIQHFLKACSKEAILWGQLSHANILPFYGIHRAGNRLSLVSPWMTHGDINNYLREHASTDRILLFSDVAYGLRFLHKNGIIHGDLKGPNILVDESGRACVADFGISSISDPSILAWTSHSAVASKGGSVRWQAPELFKPDDDEDVHNTTASDVYALGCVAYEIFTGYVPFASSLRDAAVLLRVMTGDKPARPLDSSLSWLAWGLTETLWSVMQDCWATDPLERPTIDQILERLKSDMPRDIQVDDSQQNNAISPARFREMTREGPDDLSIHTLEKLLKSA